MLRWHSDAIIAWVAAAADGHAAIDSTDVSDSVVKKVRKPRRPKGELDV